jgi:hypothetical protein
MVLPMNYTGGNDYYSMLNSTVMKKSIILLTVAMIIFTAMSSCGSGGSGKNPGKSIANEVTSEGLIPVGSDMITDVILRPDSLGDPWELEKVKGFDANALLKTLLDNIYSEKITVYSALTEEPMKQSDVKKIMGEFNSDLKKIAKLQFCDNWFLDPSTGNVVRKTKSIIFGYEIPREAGLPPSYKAMFRIKPL